MAPMEWMTNAMTPAKGPIPTITAMMIARISASIDRQYVKDRSRGVVERPSESRATHEIPSAEKAHRHTDEQRERRAHQSQEDRLNELAQTQQKRIREVPLASPRSLRLEPW